MTSGGQVTREDYTRAERLLPWNVKNLVFKVDVVPNWIEKTDCFWYRNATRTGKDFVLVDPVEQDIVCAKAALDFLSQSN